MARGFVTALAAAVRAAERQARAQRREIDRQARATLRAEKEAQPEAARLFHENRSDEADALTKEAQDRFHSLETLLQRSLTYNPVIDLATLKREPPPKPEPAEPPSLETFLPAKPGFPKWLLAETRTEYKKSVQDAHDRFVSAMADFNAAELNREAEFDATVAETHKYNEQIDEWIAALKASEPHAAREYLALVLERTQIIEDFEGVAQLGLLPASSHLVVDYFLPDVSIIPDHMSFTYNKARRTITGKVTSLKDRKSKYADVLAQSALAILSTIFRADTRKAIQCITLNGMIDTTDRSTGRDARVCVFSVRADRDTFESFNLRRVSPIECLRRLKVAVSRSPEELSPVKPILELNMTDPRFIESGDVLSGLDQRPNLMDFSPGEFETLITNLR